MIYRKLPHGTEQISIIGMGSTYMGTYGAAEAEKTMAEAIACGINYFDMAAADPIPFAAYGNAIGTHRKDLYFQIHFGADYTKGSYGWTCVLDEIKKSICWQLDALKTDYIDFGFLHCVDAPSDLQRMQDNGVLDYLQQLQTQGIVRHLGLSTHSPSLANAALDLQILDMLMFSINPAYDYGQDVKYALGSSAQRMALYRRCAQAGVGISVMKPFCGGQLLAAGTSPFSQALTPYQCLQYALDKPGVVTVLPGVSNCKDLKDILHFLNATAQERDYSVLGSFAPRDAAGHCVYCNHCQPCPAGLDIGKINKYFDLAKAGDSMARSHYKKLSVHAQDCLQCGHCNERCPFHVDQVSRMADIYRYFEQ